MTGFQRGIGIGTGQCVAQVGVAGVGMALDDEDVFAHAAIIAGARATGLDLGQAPTAPTRAPWLP